MTTWASHAGCGAVRPGRRGGAGCGPAAAPHAAGCGRRAPPPHQVPSGPARCVRHAWCWRGDEGPKQRCSKCITCAGHCGSVAARQSVDACAWQSPGRRRSSRTQLAGWQVAKDALHTAQHIAASRRTGLRTETSIIAETAQAFSTHHIAVLVGYGAHAVVPYLAFETCRQWRASPRCALRPARPGLCAAFADAARLVQASSARNALNVRAQCSCCAARRPAVEVSLLMCAVRLLCCEPTSLH
jgi:hypothetical protein